MLLDGLYKQHVVVARGAGVNPQIGKQTKVFLSVAPHVEDYQAARHAAMSVPFSKFHRSPRPSNPTVQLQTSTACECMPERQLDAKFVSAGVATDENELSSLADAMQSVGIGTTNTRSLFVGT